MSNPKTTKNRVVYARADLEHLVSRDMGVAFRTDIQFEWSDYEEVTIIIPLEGATNAEHP